ncbi:SH3 and multiple ankyrin repeat domains protein 1 [Drosophila tropicalis]|uniref:SH3 and multiple ankyrin repeat domains protein 1 n=1 Tax=Drosophila tropicalis TaxID=46794 RepID=UPI0035ABD4C0
MATTTGKTMSSSCQSIATAASSAATTVAAVSISASNATSVGSLIAAQQQQHSHPHQRGEPMSQHYVNGTGSLGRLKFHKSLDASDEELDYPQLSQSTHILGRYKSERFLAGVSKPDEDRRRRTIIVEKKGDSYGFTLQSYGIHYKRDEELEMITYVDYVEYGGPAYRAGMREGDVILSINGSDMEKADHKTIVEFIKQCDTRMRMVVLFEDCVRKVDLHMRYIQLQSMLQQKMNELERVHLRERELLEGKWKTHSLPARKKQNAHNNNSPSDAEGISPTEMGGAGDIGGAGDAIYYRPTLSTEDVPKQMQMAAGGISGIGISGGGGGGGGIIPPPAQFMLTYHYLDPTYRYVLRPHQHPAAAGSDDYLDAVSLQRSQSDQNQQQRFILQRAESIDTNTPASQYHTVAGPTTTTTGGGKPPEPPPRTCEKHKPPAKPPKIEKSKGSSKHCHKGHSCNPCLGHFRWKSTEKTSAIPPGAGAGGGDNVSLDAYDLASPCCNTECVPTRRRHHHHREHTHKHKHREREREREKEKVERTRPKSQSHASPNSNSNGGGATAPHHHHHHHHHQQQQQQQQPQQQQHIHYHPQTTTNQSQSGSMRSRYFDLASGLASHCSLHSCTSSEFAPADSTSYTTSISTDTLFWDPKSEANSRQPSTKSRQSSYDQQQPQTQSQQPQQHHHHHHHPIGAYHHRYHVMATQVQPSQIYPNLPMAYVQKPKSWDNLAATTGGSGGGGGGVGGGAATLGGAAATYGYGYLDTVAIKPPVKLQIAQQRHSMPRIRNPYGRYSTYGDVENYAPPPTEFVGELTTTTTTTITAKSTEELLTACDCLTPQQQQALKAAQYQLSQNQKMTHQNSCQMGYYSHLPRPTTDVGTSTTTTTSSSNTTTTNNMGQQHHNGAGDVSTVSEATRL